MFNIGWSEFLVIGVVALIAIGPKELPGVLRMAGQWIGKARRLASDFQGQFQQALREAELSDVQKSFTDVHNDVTKMTENLTPEDIHKDIEQALDISPRAVQEPVAELPAPEPLAELPKPDASAPAGSDTKAAS